MKKFIRVGEKLSDIYINKVNISDFSIIIPACGAFRGPTNAPEWIKKGARILQSYVFKLTEVELPIYLDSYPLRTKGKIVVGDCFRDDVKEVKYDNDEYYFEIKGHNVFFNGGKRGVLYGIYTFLEKYLGFRFFSADVERILYQKRIELNNLQERYNPPFEYRELCDWNAWDPDFSVKSKINGNFVRKLREEDGYSIGFAGGFKGLVHTFSKLIDPAKYYQRTRTSSTKTHISSSPLYLNTIGSEGELIFLKSASIFIPKWWLKPFPLKFGSLLSRSY